MKKAHPFSTLFTVGFTLVVFTLTLSSAPAQSIEQETELLQEVWGMEKRELVEQYMGLFEIDGQDFWPVYEEYAAKRKEIGAERINIIMDYANNYTSMTDEKAKSITNAVFNNNVKLEKLQQKYYKKMSKAVGALKATEFMQFEKYLDTVIKAELQGNIPFLKELKQMKNS
jgi:hypothetical protein